MSDDIEQKYNFLVEFLDITWRNDAFDSLFWRVDSEIVSLFVKCNDVFYWGCADLEEVTSENIKELRKAYLDCKEVVKFGHIYGDVLFCARMRKLRPQGAFYKEIPVRIAALLDECGPPREADPGNPVGRK